MLAAVALPLVGCGVAIVVTWRFGFMGWLYLSMLVGGWLLTGTGITIGFHRLLTHRSFETYRWVKLVWVTLGALSVEGSPLVWCAVHRRHHELSDQPGDPHSPHLHGKGAWNSLRGLWYAHAGWLFTGYWSSPDLERYVPDLLSDKALVAVDRVYYLWVLVSLTLPAAIGGVASTEGATWSWQGALLGLVWGGLVRIAVTHHITWSINSICHVFGSRDYRTGDDSRNNLVCGLLGLGEGWHNNHHAFPTSARHGLAWWQLDASWLVIRGLELIGMAWNVRLPNKKTMAEKAW
jgi:stearoyl-CoA desaturase (Delta-9 desaturase)